MKVLGDVQPALLMIEGKETPREKALEEAATLNDLTENLIISIPASAMTSLTHEATVAGLAGEKGSQEITNNLEWPMRKAAVRLKYSFSHLTGHSFLS